MDSSLFSCLISNTKINHNQPEIRDMIEGIPNIKPFKKRLEEIDNMMNESNFYSDQRRAAILGREHQKLSELVEIYSELEKVLRMIEDNRALIEEKNFNGDVKELQELQDLAREEIKELEKNRESLKQSILIAMIPPDKSDSRNTIVEIRAGAGGDEASLFVGDLFKMYTRFAELMGWQVEPMGSSESECGGFKEIAFLLKGEDVYKFMKFECGVHRVQRIPVTESGGRIHTSTVTVAVLPEAEEVDIEINPSDLEISVCRASGPGGQGVNTTDSAVQILYKPTGMIVTCADERSQTKNKVKALKVLRSRLLQAKQDEEREKYATNRKNQVGTGDRSERIRTYNFPQSRLTDHRIGFSLHNLDKVMAGEIRDVIDALIAADQEDRVQNLLNQDEKSED